MIFKIYSVLRKKNATNLEQHRLRRRTKYRASTSSMGGGKDSNPSFPAAIKLSPEIIDFRGLRKNKSGIPI
jgi:hypothetical protein